MKPLSDVGSSRGAPMGRSDDRFDPDAVLVFEVERLRMVDGDYDEGGAYWGHVPGEYIYRFQEENGEGEIFIRAKNLDAAKTSVLKDYPAATFAASADLEEFLASYIETALWSTSNDRYEDDPENEAEMLDGTGYDLADECKDAMRALCSAFLAEHGAMLKRAIDEHGYSMGQAGHDFWLSSQGHGTGFFDRKIGEYADALQEAARAVGESDLYVGDDDLIHMDGEARIAGIPPISLEEALAQPPDAGQGPEA